MREMWIVYTQAHNENQLAVDHTFYREGYAKDKALRLSRITIQGRKDEAKFYKLIEVKRYTHGIRTGWTADPKDSLFVYKGRFETFEERNVRLKAEAAANTKAAAKEAAKEASRAKMSAGGKRSLVVRHERKRAALAAS